MVWGDRGEGVMGGEISMEEFLKGEENFHEGGAGFFSIFLKSNEKKKI